MKKSRYTDGQILTILKQAEAGAPVPELCREHGMSSATFYKWRGEDGGVEGERPAAHAGRRAKSPCGRKTSTSATRRVARIFASVGEKKTETMPSESPIRSAASSVPRSSSGNPSS